MLAPGLEGACLCVCACVQVVALQTELKQRAFELSHFKVRGLCASGRQEGTRRSWHGSGAHGGHS